MRTDTELQRDVMEEIAWDPKLHGTEIGVAAGDGVVTLSGRVPTFAQKRAAEESVRYLTAVKGVTDLIALRPRTSVTDVQNKIESALRRSAESEAKQIDVTTTDGAVTLSGHVHSWADRRSAELAAWSAPGVREVKDLLTVAG